MKRSKLVLSAKWCSFIHCPWKAFQKTPTPMLVLRWMPSKVREPRQPSLEGLNDHRQHHSCRATAERWTPDRRGWVRENRADTQGSDSFPGRDRNEWTTRPPHRQPHGRQPTRLLHPWGFQGKSTGVGCHRLLRRVGYVCSNT